MIASISHSTFWIEIHISYTIELMHIIIKAPWGSTGQKEWKSIKYTE